MDSEAAPGFIFDRGVYYPPNGNFYGYVCTGMEPSSEWDDQHKFLGLDGQNPQLSALQTENFPCVYYTPSYDYAQSPYNPFNPYIPGAVLGTETSFVGPQQCFTDSSYVQTVSQPGYIPVITQASSAALLNGSVKYTPALSSMSVTATPFKTSFENLSLEPSYSSAHQLQIAGRLMETAGANVAAPRVKFSQYGHLTSASAPQMPQMQGLPVSYGFTSPGSNGSGWVPGDRMLPKTHYGGFINRSLGEQNMGPRTYKPKTRLSTPITLRAYTTKAGNGNLNENMVVHADQYNKNDFPVDYPDAKFFVIKSYSEDDVHKSIKYNVWSSTISGNKKLDFAYEEAQRLSAGKPRKCPVFLFFSVNASGHFCGVAEMVGSVDFHKDMDFWLHDKWTGCFPVKWHIIKDVPNASFRHIILVNNEYRPVTSSRDTQEVPYLPGINMLTIFKNSPLKTLILDDFMYYEERERVMHEEKSMFLGTKSYGISASPASVSLVKLGEEISHPPMADGKYPNDKSEGKKMISHIADHDERADDKVTIVPYSKPSEEINQSSLANGNQVGLPSLANGNQLNGKTDGNKNYRAKNQSEHDARVRSRQLTKESQDKAEKSVEKAAARSEMEEADTFTVGSMQINITDTIKPISGTLTISSIPVHAKGSKS